MIARNAFSSGGSSVDLASPGAIGGTTPAAGTFTGLTVNQGTLTDPASGINLTATWNDVADTFTGFFANFTDTNSASGSLPVDIQVNSSSVFKVQKNGITTASRWAVSGSSSYLDSNCVVAGTHIVESGLITLNSAQNVIIKRGSGSPESVVTASVGSLFLRTDGGTGTTLYVKESGTGNTGWVAK